MRRLKIRATITYIFEMRKLILALTLVSIPAAAVAEEDRGLSLMERGAQLFMEGILKEMEPAIDSLEELGPMMRDFAEQMGPNFGALLQQVEDWSLYEAPEVLPNGDIIIRRKPDAEPDTEAEDGTVDI